MKINLISSLLVTTFMISPLVSMDNPPGKKGGGSLDLKKVEPKGVPPIEKPVNKNGGFSLDMKKVEPKGGGGGRGGEVPGGMPPINMAKVEPKGDVPPMAATAAKAVLDGSFSRLPKGKTQLKTDGNMSASVASVTAGGKAGIIPEGLKLSRDSLTISGSAHVERISFVTLPDQSDVVIKFFKTKKDYDAETRTWAQDNKIVEEYNKIKEGAGSQKRLPIITKILGFQLVEYKNEKGVDDSKYVEYLEGAKGETIKELLESANPGNLEDLKKIFADIGRQFGNIYALLNPDKTQKTKKHLVHPDSNLGNFMYAKNEQKLYWIDISGINFSDEEEVKGFRKGTELNNKAFAVDMPNMITSFMKGKDKDIDKARIMVLLHQAFFHGYKEVVDTVRDEPLTIEFVLDQNSYNNAKNYTGWQAELKGLPFNVFAKRLEELRAEYKDESKEDIDFLGGYSK